MYTTDIKKEAKENTYFRKVLHTGKHTQLVVMNIPVGEEIGEEVHPDIDQMLFFMDGDGEVILDGEKQSVKEHDVVFVHAGTLHNITNIGDEDLTLFTVYSPPEHKDGTIHKTKKDAEHVEKGYG